MIDASTVEPMPDQDPFWDRREILTHLYTFARARRVSPWAVLGCALVDATAHVPPHVVLPALVGGHGSLNLGAALVGPSGAGKGAAEAAARDALAYADEVPVPVVPLGSGEGIAATFRPPGTNPDDPNPVTTAIFSAPEIDTWAALSVRQGSTVSAELRKLWSGETIGQANAAKDTRRIVAAHTYRACWRLGVQPLRSGPLLAAADGGLPQRNVWLPAVDPDAPDTAPQTPAATPAKLPNWSGRSDVTVHGGRIVLGVPDAARTEIDAHRLAVLRGDPEVDPLDGHALLTQLKVAAALMAVDERTAITDEDWGLAGVVMNVSTVTREACQRALDDQHRRSNRAKAHAAAERDEIIADRKLARCREGVERALSKLEDDGHIARHDLRRKVRADLRPYFDTVIAQLIDDGTVAEVRRDGGTMYGRRTRVHGGTRRSNSGNDPCTARTRVHGGVGADQGKHPKQQPPPGAPTERTPGLTERVQQIVEPAHNGHQAAADGVSTMAASIAPTAAQLSSAPIPAGWWCHGDRTSTTWSAGGSENP